MQDKVPFGTPVMPAPPPTNCVAVTVPVKVGEARLAFKLSAVVANAVVASCVVLVPAAAVGAAGVPVNVGEAKGAAPVMFPTK